MIELYYVKSLGKTQRPILLINFWIRIPAGQDKFSQLMK